MSNGAPWGIRNRGGGAYNPDCEEHAMRMMGVTSARTVPEIHKKRDGYLLCRADGTVRFLGWWESVLYRCGFRSAEDF